jgi:hypothetical protein
VKLSNRVRVRNKTCSRCYKSHDVNQDLTTAPIANTKMEYVWNLGSK